MGLPRQKSPTITTDPIAMAPESQAPIRHADRSFVKLNTMRVRTDPPNKREFLCKSNPG